MSEYKPMIGDIIKYDNIPMVIIDLKIHEDLGSCSYDR